jgi:Tol biopolymer transport system component
MKVALIAASAVIALGVAVTGEARAAFPGANGKIVFRTNRDGNAEIYTMNADGTNRVDLTRSPAEEVEPRWSPDGTRIVFASNRTGNYEIYTMAADGTGVTRLTFTSANNRRPAWTAEGAILFHSDRDGNREIYRMNADGSGQTNLTQSTTDDGYATAAPRGDKVAFTSDRGGDYHLYLLNAGSGGVQQVTNTAGAQDFEANWSPSGNDLVFVRFDSGFNTSDLYVAHSNGSGLRQLTSTPDRTEFEPAWSPDGKRIVFHACSGLGGTNQHCADYVMNADGIGETEVSTPQIPYVDAFSSDRIDPFWGIPFRTGSGLTIGQANGQLEVTVPSSTANDPSAGYADVGVASACHLMGDFDVQVDYRLLQWAGPAFVNMSFDTFSSANGSYETYGMFVFDPGFGTGISTHFPGPVNTFVNAPEAAGTLRFARIGDTITAYRLVAGSWSPIQSTLDTQTDVGVNLNLFSNAAAFSHPDVKVAYDNFRVSSGAFSCPTWWDDNAPDWQAVR